MSDAYVYPVQACIDARPWPLELEPAREADVGRKDAAVSEGLWIFAS